MKKTLNDFPTASYSFTPDSKTIRISWFPISLRKSNIYAIINASTNQVIHRIEKAILWIEQIVDNNIILIIDTSWMTTEDDLAFVFDVPDTTATYIPDDNMYRAISDLKMYLRWLNKLDIGWRLRVNAEVLGTLSTIATLTTLTQANLLLDQRAIWGIDAWKQLRDMSRIAFNQNFLSRLS